MDFFSEFSEFFFGGGGVYEDFFELTTQTVDVIFDAGWMNQVWLFF